MTAPARPRGERIRLEAGAYTAEVSAVGAVLESLTIAGRDLVVRSPEDGPMLLHRGAIIAPWPNRIGDGRYVWDGRSIQVPITEVERGNALHGLISFQAFDVVSASPSSAVLATQLVPSPGYPFQLRLEVAYELDEHHGLRTTMHAQNAGAHDAPYGACPHPYLIAGPEPLDAWTLTCSAGTVLEVDPERLLPTGTAPIPPGSAFDFSAGRVIGDQRLDHAFTDLQRDEEGRAVVRITAPGGTGVELTADAACRWLQLHTADRPEPENDRIGLAVEPMTCPPDAFRTGVDVVRLRPGQEHRAVWSIRGW